MRCPPRRGRPEEVLSQRRQRRAAAQPAEAEAQAVVRDLRQGRTPQGGRRHEQAGLPRQRVRETRGPLGAAEARKREGEVRRGVRLEEVRETVEQRPQPAVVAPPDRPRERRDAGLHLEGDVGQHLARAGQAARQQALLRHRPVQQVLVAACGPADAQPRQPEPLREAVDRHAPLVGIHHRRGAATGVGLAVHLVVDEPQPVPPAQGDEAAERRPIERGAGRAVGEVRQHQTGVRADRGREAIEVEGPAALGVERDAADRAEAHDGEFGRTVDRHHHDRVVGRLQGRAQHAGDRLLGAVAGQDAARIERFVALRDRGAQPGRAARVGIAEADAAPAAQVIRPGVAQQRRQGQRLRVGGREVLDRTIGPAGQKGREREGSPGGAGPGGGLAGVRGPAHAGTIGFAATRGRRCMERASRGAAGRDRPSCRHAVRDAEPAQGRARRGRGVAVRLRAHPRQRGRVVHVVPGLDLDEVEADLGRPPPRRLGDGAGAPGDAPRRHACAGASSRAGNSRRRRRRRRRRGRRARAAGGPPQRGAGSAGSGRRS